MDNGLTRRPRLGPITPEDVAAIWRALSPQRQEQVIQAAGTRIDEFIRLRIELVRQRMFGKRVDAALSQPPVSATGRRCLAQSALFNREANDE